MVDPVDDVPRLLSRIVRNKTRQDKLVRSPRDVPVVPLQFLLASPVGPQSLILGYLVVIHKAPQHVIPDYHTTVRHIKDGRYIPICSAKDLGESGRWRGKEPEEVRPEGFHTLRRHYLRN